MKKHEMLIACSIAGGTRNCSVPAGICSPGVMDEREGEKEEDEAAS